MSSNVNFNLIERYLRLLVSLCRADWDIKQNKEVTGDLSEYNVAAIFVRPQMFHACHELISY